MEGDKVVERKGMGMETKEMKAKGAASGSVLSQLRDPTIMIHSSDTVQYIANLYSHFITTNIVLMLSYQRP
jgi:hypothetical protein